MKTRVVMTVRQSAGLIDVWIANRDDHGAAADLVESLGTYPVDAVGNAAEYFAIDRYLPLVIGH